MTNKQKEQLNKLLQLKQQEEKHDDEFFKEVRKRKVEVMKELNIENSAEWQELAQRLLEACNKEPKLDNMRTWVTQREARMLS